MKHVIPVNPKILVWARNTAGVSVSAAAEKLSKDPDFIIKIESGEEDLTYSQLQTLANDLYKRPLAVFFFPEPPDEPTIEQAFRTLPSQDILELDRDTRLNIRFARYLQLSLYELFEDQSISEPVILSNNIINKDPINSIHSIRELLGIDIDQQKSYINCEAAFKKWRSALEGVGIFVFKKPFKNSSYCGFSLYDKSFPIIYVNNKNAYSRQIFTLFHELCHLILKGSSISYINNEYYNRLSTSARNTESLCNRFASYFLVPESDISNRIQTLSFDDETQSDRNIAIIAKEYSVSREVILRRLIELKVIDRSQYEYKAALWSGQKREDKSTSDRGNPISSYLSYLSERYLTTVAQKYNQGIISIEQLSRFINAKTSETAEKVFETFVERHATIL